MIANKIDTKGFRVAWFIPVEMIMSGCMLFLFLHVNALAAVTFLILFMTLTILQASHYAGQKKTVRIVWFKLNRFLDVKKLLKIYAYRTLNLVKKEFYSARSKKWLSKNSLGPIETKFVSYND